MQQRKDGEHFSSSTGDPFELLEQFKESVDRGDADSAVFGEVPEINSKHKISGKTVKVVGVEDEGFTLTAEIVDGKANGFPRPGTECTLNGLTYEVERLSFACIRIHLKMK